MEISTDLNVCVLNSAFTRSTVIESLTYLTNSDNVDEQVVVIIGQKLT